MYKKDKNAPVDFCLVEAKRFWRLIRPSCLVVDRWWYATKSMSVSVPIHDIRDCAGGIRAARPPSDQQVAPTQRFLLAARRDAE